jgi:hypothetical protein
MGAFVLWLQRERDAMKDTRQWIPIGGLLATILAASYGVVQLHGQAQPTTADFTKATTVQVKNAQGQIVLQGDLRAPVDEDGGLERRATLAATGVDADASGQAEIEFEKSGDRRQEVEFEVQDVDPGASFTFVIDGIDVASAKSNDRGRAQVEVNVLMP